MCCMVCIVYVYNILRPHWAQPPTKKKPGAKSPLTLVVPGLGRNFSMASRCTSGPWQKKRPWMVWMAMDYYLLNLQKIAQGHASRPNMTQLSAHQMPSTVLTCLKMSEVCCSLKGESSQYGKQKQSAVLPEMPGNLRTCYQAATDCRNPSPPGYDRNTVLKYLTFQST